MKRRSGGGPALSQWLERLTEAARSDAGPLASMTNVAGALREAVEAEHVTVYALKDGDCLPLVTVPEDSPGPPALPDDIALPAAGEPVRRDAVSDPSGWGDPTDRLVVPVVHQDSAPGLLVLSWPEPRVLAPELRTVVDSASAVVGLALSAWHLLDRGQRRAHLHRAVIEGASMLVSQSDDAQILGKLVDTYTDLVGATLCAIALVDARTTTITSLATRDTNPLDGPIPLSDIPESILGPIERQWRSDPVPIDLGDEPWLREVAGGGAAGATWYRLLPLLLGHDACGAVVLGFPRDRRLDPEETLALGSLTDIASAALEQAFHVQRRTRQLERVDALHRLDSALAAGDDAPALVAHMNEVLAPHGVRVGSLAFADPTVARHLHAGTLNDRERAGTFRRNPWTDTGDGTASIPMASGRRVVGAMRVCPVDPGAEARSLVEAVANGVADAVAREQLREAVAEAERQRCLAAEHRRIAHDLHDSVGQLFVAVRLLAEDHVESIPAGSPTRERMVRVGQLAAQGKQEIDHAIRGLALVPSGSDGIVEALRKLAREVAHDSGLDVGVHVHGKRARLAGAIERALFRVAHEALANAWRHARCRHVAIVLSFDPHGTRLCITDDGVGLAASAGAARRPAPAGIGTTGMRQVVEELGGRVVVREVEPSGTEVEAHIPGGRP